MKKRIFNYEQQRLLDLNIEADELIILDYIAHFKNSGKMEEHIKDSKCWNWISWKKVADDLPFLRLKKEAIQRKCLYYLGVKPLDWNERFLKMTENTKKKVKSYKFLGLIEFATVGELGSEKTVFRFTDKYYKLIEEEGETEHKKADTLLQVPTSTTTKNYSYNKSIQQNKEKYNPKISGNKNKFRNFEESFLDYSEEELEKIIEINQADKIRI
ncbi:hypothetical protein LZ906_017520 (plasmid) [Paraclostridium ghonii]|uniref:hypothetical protein n=1 Tax=Paraclostridium ghonii TaxID=29358 RepID=UPI00202CA7A2|nr:hypothetical protein [Paeniclostridium ghonii]MCM0166542.1 hypothetical protein [Paeniclostridium ghonii]